VTAPTPTPEPARRTTAGGLVQFHDVANFAALFHVPPEAYAGLDPAEQLAAAHRYLLATYGRAPRYWIQTLAIAADGTVSAEWWRVAGGTVDEVRDILGEPDAFSSTGRPDLGDDPERDPSGCS
jgi:hypothetical protein